MLQLPAVIESLDSLLPDAEIVRLADWKGARIQRRTRALILTNMREVAGALSRLPGMTRGCVYGWLAVYAGASGGPVEVRLRRVLTCTETSPWTSHLVPERDRRLALGEAGPFAYAAGLSLTEAEECRAAGTLDVERLRMLAGLRGWVFPPLP